MGEKAKRRVLEAWLETLDEETQACVECSAERLVERVRLVRFERRGKMATGLGPKGALELVYELGGVLAGRYGENT